MIASLKQKETWVRYFSSLKFSLYCMTHPLDGFWDLTHEKRGSYAAANTILILVLATRIWQLQFTSFVINAVNWERINVFMYLASILLPLALWCIGNWALTTLFDGKGRLGQIYMATCYGMAPYVIISLPLIVISNGVTTNEADFINVLGVFSLIWAGGLILAAMMEIHEYSLSKMLLFTVATLFSMLVMVFIILMFFSMISTGIAYFISIGKELMFRM